mgnify:CR=1 FL=1
MVHRWHCVLTLTVLILALGAVGGATKSSPLETSVGKLNGYFGKSYQTAQATKNVVAHVGSGTWGQLVHPANSSRLVSHLVPLRSSIVHRGKNLSQPWRRNHRLNVSAIRRILKHNKNTKEACSKPPTSKQLPNYLHGSCENTSDGKFCNYGCQEGYEPSSAQPSIACCDGSWILPDGAKCVNVHAPKMLQFNVDTGGGDRLLNILAWIRSQHASVTGLCELNGWDQISMQKHANLSGFAYSHIFQVPSGYHIGVMASSPVRVVSEISTDFERGMLHVEINNRHYIIVHLHAHSAEKRIGETKIVANVVKDMLEQVCCCLLRVLLATQKEENCHLLFRLCLRNP